MKVGILTFHKAVNYGAVLQAYALRTAVETLGKPCSVINYVGSKMLRESKIFYFPHHESLIDSMLHLYRIPMRARTVDKFNQFLHEHLKVSKEIISDTQKLKAISTHYEAFITGSDQVFNYNGTGEDYNYYLEFESEARKKIAYAPSFGLKEIDASHRERVKNDLCMFSALSVRESVGADIVETLIGTRPPEVCDPTFLLTKEQWEQLCISPKYKKPYVLVYSFGSRHLEEYAKKLADEIGGVVVNINRSLPTIIAGKRVKNAYAPSPCEFLGLIKNAEIVVTNSFHGMAFSVILQKEFYCFINNYKNSDATNCRFQTLSEKLGLSKRIFNLGDAVERIPIDYTEVAERINLWRDQSLTFLKSAIIKK